MDPLDLKSKFDGLNIEETSVLDLGCGSYNTPISSQMRVLPFDRLVSIDAHKPTFMALHREIDQVHFAAKQHICRNREAIAHMADAMSNAYDVVLMLDVLEHFDKPTALKVVKEAKRVCFDRVIIWLPLGECPQGDIAGNPFQKHLSTWTAEELEELGFEVTVFPEQHKQFKPPVDAAWAIWKKSDITKKELDLEYSPGKPEGKGTYFDKPLPMVAAFKGSPENILIDRLDVHGDVLVCTSILPGLREKYPDAHISWHVRKGYGFALENNPYLDHVIPGPMPPGYQKNYDMVITPDHHMRWNKPMAMIHCEQAGVEFHGPELYFTQDEYASLPDELSNKILVCNTAGWGSRVCPNLSVVLDQLAQGGMDFVQIDNGPDISEHIPHPVLSLRQAAVAMWSAKLYIGIDTVFMHMAVALGVPMVLCMGPTDQYTQYTPNATIIKPYEWKNPAEPYPDTKDGIQLQASSILSGIRTKMNEFGELVNNTSSSKFVTIVDYSYYEEMINEME
jgi:hypothetical protein